jgi:hypothetical protein
VNDQVTIIRKVKHLRKPGKRATVSWHRLVNKTRPWDHGPINRRFAQYKPRPGLSGAWFFIIAAEGFNRLAKGKRFFTVSAGEGNGQGKLQLF